jgi:hypothetical protein
MAYRKLTADTGAGGEALLDAETLAALATGGRSAAGRDAGLAALAESARNADLLRALRAIAVDAAELETSIAGLRGAARVERRPVVARRWYALAASIAAAGVVGLALNGASEAPSMQASDSNPAPSMAADAGDDSAALADGGRIMVASFDGPNTSTSTDASASEQDIFSGDFDS